jgi:hypothetical protein
MKLDTTDLAVVNVGTINYLSILWEERVDMWIVSSYPLLFS